MWVARSTDEGRTFSEEVPAWAEPTGACGCCSMRALADGKGSVYALYRSAKGGDGRHVYLLSSTAKGTEFRGALLHPWKVAACPMSTMALAEGPTSMVASWDTDGSILPANCSTPIACIAPPAASGRRSHPRPSHQRDHNATD